MWVRSVIFTAKRLKNKGVARSAKNNICVSKKIEEEA